MSPILLAVLLGAAVINAFPTLNARQSITALTTAQINAFTPYTWYASAAYCTNTQTLAWDCGSKCSLTSILRTTWSVCLLITLTCEQPTVMPTQISNRLPQVVMVTRSSTVSVIGLNLVAVCN